MRLDLEEHNAALVSKDKNYAMSFFKDRLRKGYDAEYPVRHGMRWVVLWTFV